MNSVNTGPFSSDNVKSVMQSIHEAALRVGRDPMEIQLVAATKTVAAETMREGHAAGIMIFGENRLQEAQQKQAELSDIEDVSWHFIGQVQRRKIKDVVGHFDLIHSVENLEQAREMDKRAKALRLTQPVLLQVNVSGESTKGGFSVSAFKEALPNLDALENLEVRGLMTIPPWSKEVETTRPYFRQLKELACTVKQQAYHRIMMDDLSMGMSQDYIVAVEEGATLVRVGTALFGSRSSVQ